MFGGTELLIIIVVALIVFGPKELPKAMRSASAMMKTLTRVSGDFRKQFDASMREAEKQIDHEEIRDATKTPVSSGIDKAAAASETNVPTYRSDGASTVVPTERDDPEKSSLRGVGRRWTGWAEKGLEAKP